MIILIIILIIIMIIIFFFIIIIIIIIIMIIIIIIILSLVIAPFPYKHAQRRIGLRLLTVLAKHILTTKLLTHIGVVPVTITPVHGHSLLYAVHWPVSGLGIRTFKNEHVHQDY